MKKTTLKILIIIGCIAVGIGAYICISSAIRTSHSHNERRHEDAHEEKSEETFAEHVLMAHFCNFNWGLVSGYEGYWAYTNYDVYYDGTIEIEKVYSYRSIDFTSSGNSTISDIDFAKLKKGCNKFGSSTTNHDACDGDGWTIETYKPNGKKIYTGSGYIYGDKNMEKTIIPILTKYDDTSLPETLIVEEMPGYKADGDATHEDVDSSEIDLSNQVYIVFKQRFSDDDSFVDTYTLYYDGTFTADSPVGVPNGTDTLTQEELQAIQFYEYYLINGGIPIDEGNSGYAYTIYDEAGNIIASADYDEPVNNSVMDAIDFLFYIPYNQ